MDDSRIVDLYWARDEKAIGESDKKYGRMLMSLSFSLLSSREDAEECLNDTYLGAWNAMPNARPRLLGAFLAKIIRRISVDRFRREHREKRGGIDNAIFELTECVTDSVMLEDEMDGERLRREINEFLYSQSAEKRAAFVLRYFYAKPISEIALRLRISEPKVKTMLFRMREELKGRLEENGLL